MNPQNCSSEEQVTIFKKKIFIEGCHWNTLNIDHSIEINKTDYIL